MGSLGAGCGHSLEEWGPGGGEWDEELLGGRDWEVGNNWTVKK